MIRRQAHRSVRHAARDLQRAARRGRAVQRRHGGGLVRGGERTGRAAELLDREPRLRASILLPMHDPALAVTEIERKAGDRRFVQVLLLAMGEMLLGRRIYWPIYAAAEKHGLAIGIHARLELSARTDGRRAGRRIASRTTIAQNRDRVRIPAAQLSRRRRVPEISEAQARADRIGLHLAAHLAVANQQKPGAGVRPEVAVDRAAAGRNPARAGAADAAAGRRAARRSSAVDRETLGAYRCRPHAAVFRPTIRTGSSTARTCLPEGLSDEAVRALMIDNPLETYPRLQEGAAMGDNAVMALS